MAFNNIDSVAWKRESRHVHHQLSTPHIVLFSFHHMSSQNELDQTNGLEKAKIRAAEHVFSPSPLKSPSRRGILRMESNDDISLSPTKTPNGRAGSKSPKRKHLDTVGSAMKAGSKTDALLIEDFDDDETTLQEDLDEAQAIIEESKKQNDAPHLPEQGTPKRKRGRPRKEETLKKLEQVELTPRKRARRAVVEKREAEKRNREEKEGWLSGDDDSDDVYNESEEDDTPKRKRTPKRSSASPRKSRVKIEMKEDAVIENVGSSESPFSSPKKEERRTKKGRPSKQEKVTKKVHSIFQMDDLEFFQDSIKSEKSSPVPSPQKEKSNLSLNFENTGKSSHSTVPVISGIMQPENKQTESKRITKFEPLPIPEIDENGNIKDEEYLRKYFSGVHVDLEAAGKLTDERAFFLEGSEGYFEQHNLRFRPSANSLATRAPVLEYDEFIPMVKLGEMVYKAERAALFDIHRKLYHQWCFELSQGYSLNFYGVGSKIDLVLDFVQNYMIGWYEHTLQTKEEYPVIMVVNGYNPSTKLKTVIHDIVSAIITPEMQKQHNIRMPKHVSEAFPFLMNNLRKMANKKKGIVKPDLVLVVHNIDGDAFRDERSQNFLSQLAALPNVWFITSTDNVNASLLWDLYRFKNFNFLWHDATTYQPYSTEMSFKDVLNMGRSKKFVGSKGARYVLTSLSSNARSLYRVLLQMQLEKLKETTSTKAGETGLRGNAKTGVEMRSVYEKCLQEYVTSNEMNFRSILGEYVEHKMCTLTKNSGGTEVVFVPFTYDEMAMILKDEFDVESK
ncbi:hypothetical protein CLUG_04875 [Clavispora lusitaniae ATCC 42720]|uniref:Origin recognition complex subunit n=1 Tax=Clavispora lusitaniae (strain ATCC 42720) TaxID=306902 RepID=C4Y9I5_CLAL4|nr:uncharacterized protein CLUG_04875 [Clavispora lusitaniae ATCC 42720]EEQ40747.1 hypothetical protein CLUG_04875 [Clavispora lusitaniae ATCC 42720]KAF5209352.1 Origin recognition complex subunit 2 [Clavispora lusitaniae]